MQPVTDLFVLAIFVMMPVLLVRSFRPPRDKDQARELEDWLEERLARQADEFDKKLRASQSALADQNYAAIRGVKDAVDGMGAQLTGSQTASRPWKRRWRAGCARWSCPTPSAWRRCAAP